MKKSILIGLKVSAALILSGFHITGAQAQTGTDPTDAECADIMGSMGSPAPDTGSGSGAGTGSEGNGTGGATGTGQGSAGGSGSGGTDSGTPDANPTPGDGATPATPTPKPTPAPKPTVIANGSGSGPNGRVTLPNGNAAKCQQGIKMTRSDQASINRAKAAKSVLQAAGKKYGIDWRILAAIGVRETAFRNIDSPRVGDPGMGVFQLTNQPGVTRAQAHDLTFAANYAAKMIAENKRLLKRKFPKFTETQLMHAAIASYNFGPNEIKGNPERIDIGTEGWKEGRPYGESVLLAANCFG